MDSTTRASTTLATARDLLERLMDLGERQLFELTDGRSFEGYVVEVGETAVLVMDSAPGASDEPVEIALESIDLGTLRYLDDGVIVPFASA